MAVEQKQQTLGNRIVGQRVAGREAWRTLPVGAVLRREGAGNGDVWTVVAEERAAQGYHMYPDGQHQTRVRFDHFGTTPYLVIGDYTKYYSATMEGSLDAYKARFKQAIQTGATRNGINQDVVNRALRDLGCEGMTGGITLGGPLMEQDLNTLPVNSVVVFGDPGSDTFTLWRKTEGGGWVATLAGPTPIPNSHQRILVTAPGVDAVWVAPTEAQTAEEEQAINEFKARAYRVGMRQKRAHGWCDVYDNIMESVGITRDTLVNSQVAGFTVGAVVSPEEAAMLPEGALLYSLSTAGHFHLFIRDNAMGNVARTRFLITGDGEQRNYNNRMRLSAGPNRVGGESILPDNTPLNTGNHLRQMPVGVRFFIGNDLQNVWSIVETPTANNRCIGYTSVQAAEQHGWGNTPNPNTNRLYTLGDFGHQPLHIISVPDPNNPERSIH